MLKFSGSDKKLTGLLAVPLAMRPISGRLLMLLLAGLVTALTMLVFPAALDTLEERLGSHGWVLGSSQIPEERLTIVAIDEKSLAEVGPWPWPREDMARLVTALDDAGVQLQLHDIVYPESREGDQALAIALDQARGAVIAQLPALQDEGDVRTGLMTHPLTGINCNAEVNVASAYVASHPGFADIPKGHIAPLVASDGTIRKVPAFVCVDGQAYPALVISALLQATNAQDWSVTVEQGRGFLVPERVMRLNAYPGLVIPLDQAGNLRVSYRDDPQNYRAISAVDVMDGTVGAEMLENSWVLVGATAFGMGDIVPTPYAGSAPGVELQARLLTSLIDTRIPYSPRYGDSILLLLVGLFAAFLMLIAGLRERIAAYGLPLSAAVLPVVALLLHWQLLLSYEIWLGWVLPALYGAVAASLLLLLEQARVRVERSRVFGNLNAYLPSDVAREIAYALPSSNINAKRCDVTLLSADLRNFAAFGEARPAEESAAILHFFFVKAAEIVERFGGRIHEFKGDSLLAVWDGQTAEAAKRALNAAQVMQDEIHRDMPQHPPAGLEPLALGIGLEQGPALSGSIGPAQRRTHTLLGDTVTITLRIQEMTAELAQPILLGECIARQLSDLKPESQGSFLLNGLKIPHTLFAPAMSDMHRRSRHEQPSLKVVSGGRR